MRHVRAVSRNPVAALSLVELDSLILFLGRLFEVLTSAVTFWDLLKGPDA